MQSPKQMRETAQEWVRSAKGKLESSGLSDSEKQMISILSDMINAHTLVALADLQEALSPQNRYAQARRIVEQNDRIRAAAAQGFENGDWTNLDAILNGAGSDTGSESE